MYLSNARLKCELGRRNRLKQTLFEGSQCEYRFLEPAAFISVPPINTSGLWSVRGPLASRAYYPRIEMLNQDRSFDPAVTVVYHCNLFLGMAERRVLEEPLQLVRSAASPFERDLALVGLSNIDKADSDRQLNLSSACDLAFHNSHIIPPGLTLSRVSHQHPTPGPPPHQTPSSPLSPTTAPSHQPSTSSPHRD